MTPAGAFCVLLSIIRQTNAHTTVEHLTTSVRVVDAGTWSWTQINWSTVDEPQFRAARLAVEMLFEDGREHADEVTTFKRDSESHPNDRLRLFKWGVAQYEAMFSTISRRPDPNFDAAIAAAKSPYTYEFMRMRFLASAPPQVRVNSFQVTLGQRLLEFNVRDRQVLYALCQSMDLSSPMGTAKATFYAKELMQLEPNRPVGYAELARLNWIAYMNSHGKNIDAAREVVKWGAEYMRRETRPVRRSDVERTSSIIERMKLVIAEDEVKQSVHH